MTRKHKEPTTTSLVVESLKRADDFMTYEMLMEATGRNHNQVSAACFHLRKHKVIDVVVNPDGKGWWYVLPETEDKRIRRVDERTPETKPRNRRKKKRPE